jgi:hypothetical protein
MFEMMAGFMRLPFAMFQLPVALFAGGLQVLTAMISQFQSVLDPAVGRVRAAPAPPPVSVPSSSQEGLKENQLPPTELVKTEGDAIAAEDVSGLQEMAGAPASEEPAAQESPAVQFVSGLQEIVGSPPSEAQESPEEPPTPESSSAQRDTRGDRERRSPSRRGQKVKGKETKL